MSENFHLAPPPKTVDGLLAVPIDITSIEAAFTFDADASSARADATITYVVGPDAGNPIFDLRQAVDRAWLDGEPFPVTQLGHHSFGTGPFTDLRVLESVQTPGSTHTLRLQYALGVPDAQPGGSDPPRLAWEPGPRLRLGFGLSDVKRARYLESWLPANLIFDQFALRLSVRVAGSVVAHSVLTNARVTVLGPNHWTLEFPSGFSALSPMLEIRASDTLATRSDSVVLPSSGRAVTIEAWKAITSSTDLDREIGHIKRLLSAHDAAYGPYHHEDRFIAVFEEAGGMAYEGGTITSSEALAHEIFHSWFARGIKPASQADSWWGEGLTAFRDDASWEAVPFDFADPPVVLCSRDPWQRGTPANAFADGAAFWRGMASLLGLSNLEQLMAELYQLRRGQPVSTSMLEEMLLCRSSNPSVVDAFHRFVYGLPDPSPAPELWLRDAVEDPGADHWAGTFWDSPDLWVRNRDDGGVAHQTPLVGQDNWFHARVKNKARAGHAAHFAVAFQSRGFAGAQFAYPADFLPCTAAKVEFDLAPGETRIVKARWARALVPPPGTHTCLLASIITRADHPIAGRQAAQHNNLAQKNLSIVALMPAQAVSIPVVLGNWHPAGDSRFDLELSVPPRAPVDVSLIHKSRAFFGDTELPLCELAASAAAVDGPVLDCGGRAQGSPSPHHEAERATSPSTLGWKVTFSNAAKHVLPITLAPFSQTNVCLELAAPADCKPMNPFKVHLVQRNPRSGQIVGGIAVEITVRAAT